MGVLQKLKEEKSVFLGLLSNLSLVTLSIILAKFFNPTNLELALNVGIFSLLFLAAIIGSSGAIIGAFYLTFLFFENQLKNTILFAAIVTAAFALLDAFIITSISGSGINLNHLFTASGVVYKLVIPYVSVFAALKIFERFR